MRYKTKRRIKIIIGILTVLILALSALLFYFRDEVLKKALVEVTEKMDQKYNCIFTVKEAHFEGISGIHFADVALVPKDNDTLFKFKKMNASISITKLLVGDVQLGALEIKDGVVQLVKNEKGKNFEAFISQKSEKKKSGKRDYADMAYRLISKALNLVPTDMDIQNLTIRLNDMGKKATIHFDQLSLEDKEMQSKIWVQTNTFTQRWKINGFADPRGRKADLSFTNIDTGAVKVPYVDERFNLQSSFDSIRMKIFDIDKDGDELHIDGYSSVYNFTVNHPKIASKPVVIKNANFDYRFLLGEDFISLDSTSTVQFNKIKFKPYVSVETEKDTIFKLKVKIPKMKSQDFIVSLPDGLFTNFQGMEATGNFSFALDFEFNKNKPKDLILDSELQKENLKIVKYGQANLSKLNSEFQYRAIIKNVPQRPIMVGLANPNYVTMNQISPYLKKCVLTTEDPSFFSHKGFIGEAFRQSIIKNIKTKKFTRGGSTISMQLVKNVFLTREKTLSRKMEEILLVYLLENNRIASKERMLEVYFNIIEWGPNVYGIGEASRYYFQKHPSQLTLNECLFLANIIPSPKKFMYQFNDQGNLKDQALRQQRYLTNLMSRRGLLPELDSIARNSPVYISGPARSQIRIREVVPAVETDSMMVDEEFEL
ncbi:MAG: transglycosylase domain-containing protein [Flavobacterium sp.]